MLTNYTNLHCIVLHFISQWSLHWQRWGQQTIALSDVQWSEQTRHDFTAPAPNLHWATGQRRQAWVTQTTQPPSNNPISLVRSRTGYLSVQAANHNPPRWELHRTEERGFYHYSVRAATDCCLWRNLFYLPRLYKLIIYAILFHCNN